jgi:hypothetical protein
LRAGAAAISRTPTSPCIRPIPHSRNVYNRRAFS